MVSGLDFFSVRIFPSSRLVSSYFTSGNVRPTWEFKEITVIRFYDLLIFFFAIIDMFVVPMLTDIYNLQ